MYTSLSDIGLTVGSETIEAIVDAMPDNSQMDTPITTSSQDGVYPGLKFGQLRVVKLVNTRVSFEFYEKDTGKRYWGYYSETASEFEKWSGWLGPVATAKPPQEYNLTTTNGRITYSKDQFARVYLYIYLTGIVIEENKILGTLPAGYRPSYLVSALARIGGSFGTIDISTSGNIALRNTYDSIENGGIFASVSFLAG